MDSSSRTAIVVGGGVAGLTAAVALLRQRWAVTVIEKAPRIEEVGAGLGLTANGLSVLDALGIGHAARRRGYPIHVEGTTDHRGNWLLRLPRVTDPASSQVMYGIHRRELHRLLLEAAASARLVVGTRVIEVDPGQVDGMLASVRCVTPAGEVEYRADLIVGADGLRSTVRNQLAGASRPRYSGKSSWRGIVDDSDLVTDEFRIMWGPGAEFGAVRISAREVYWYGYAASPEGTVWPDEKAAALGRFDGWAAPVESLIRSTPADQIMRHDVHTIAPPLRSYVHGRTVLIGDAAHAMVPTMGQGANSSLEDGICIGLLIGRAVNAGASFENALALFDAERRLRTQRIVRRSTVTGRFGADVTGKVATALRNTLLRAIPSGPAAAAGSSILSWKPPLDHGASS